MYKKIVFLSVLLLSFFANAHQPDTSTTMLVETENNTWILQIKASLTAFQQEVNLHFADTPYTTPEEFKQMVIQHIKNNLQISCNGSETIQISNGSVKLGHETSVVFEVSGIPTDLKSVHIKNSSFSDIHRNQSALVILKEGFNKEHFVLNNANKHTLELTVKDAKFIASKTQTASIFDLKMLGYLALILIPVGIYIRRKQQKEKSSFQNLN
ncbi:DUF6702 family protein [Kordia sp.]|uniref:DUF6702 family protein n=1 Tax=Kordia sp. TaxID=1965332 RepID=UPI003D2853A1